MTTPNRAALRATFERELAANRLNRFLYVHLGLAAVTSLLPLLTADDAAATAPMWILQAVLYCLSLSSLLLGLNSAHGEADEFPMLFTQPVPRWVWLAGKALGLAVLLVPAALLLAVPAALVDGLTWQLTAIAAAAAGLSVALAALGLAIGFWVRDSVRGLLTALGTWFALLFGTDLLLLAVAGAPWVQRHPVVWVAPLMLNPLDALRVTALFTIENATPPGLEAGGLAGWWIARGGLWLVVLLVGWTAGGLAAGLAGARRRID